MSRTFHHEIKVYEVQLTVTGTYYPAEYTPYNEKPDESLVEIERVSVSGSDVNIQILLCEKTMTRIEETIDRIEA